MLCSDEIRALSFPSNKESKNLIDPFDSTRLGSHFYELTPDVIFKPGSTHDSFFFECTRKRFYLESGKIVWVRMKEFISNPKDIVASLQQTHFHTRRGLILVNSSYLFPNYSGPVTCVFANFSGKPYAISRSNSPARLIFSRVNASRYVPSKLISITDLNEYDHEIADEISAMDDSFFGASKIEGRTREIINEVLPKQVNRLTIAGAGVAVMLATTFALAPLLQNTYIYGHSIKQNLTETLIEMIRDDEKLRNEILRAIESSTSLEVEP